MCLSLFTIKGSKYSEDYVMLVSVTCKNNFISRFHYTSSFQFNKLQHQQWMKEEDMKKRVYRETLRQMEHARLKKQQTRRMPSAKQAVESLTKR